MIVWNEHKTCSKLEVKRYEVPDLTLSVLDYQVLVSKSFLFFPVLFSLYSRLSLSQTLKGIGKSDRLYECPD